MKMFICSKFVLDNFLHYYLGILRKIFWKQTTKHNNYGKSSKRLFRVQAPL